MLLKRSESYPALLVLAALTSAVAPSCALFEPRVVVSYEMIRFGSQELPFVRTTGVGLDGATRGTQILGSRLMLEEGGRFTREVQSRATVNGTPQGAVTVDRISGEYRVNGSQLTLAPGAKWSSPNIWRFDLSDNGTTIAGEEPHYFNPYTGYVVFATYEKER